MPAFRDMRSDETLDQFHQRCVVPTRKETESRNAEIDAFVRFLHSEFNTPPYTVARVFKSGSLGKGTAVQGSADIDLVPVLNGLSSIQDLEDQRPALLGRMEEVSLRYWKGRISKPERRFFSLTYTLNGEKLDILPALDIESVYGGRQGVYQELTKNNFQQFSASLAPLQINFVKPQGEAVKKVIRLLKFWAKEKEIDIRSYTLELLTIHMSKTIQWRTTDNLFRNVLSQLAECGSIKVAFDRYYTSATYTRGRRAPYVLDPANPYMDTLHGKNISDISRQARDMLRLL